MQKYDWLIRIQKIFEDGRMVSDDIRDLICIKESPFDCMAQIREMFGPNGTNIWCCRGGCNGCIPIGTNIIEHMPKKPYTMRYMELKGPRCICKLWIDMLPMKEDE